MTDLLDKIDLDLDEIETRVLVTFQKLRETPSDSGIGMLNDDFRTEMHYIVDGLSDSLNSSGSKDQLHLATDRHENLRARLYIMRQLLDRQVPLSAFSRADQELDKNKPSRSSNIIINPKAMRERDLVVIEKSDSGSFIDSFKGLFRKTKATPGSAQINTAEKQPQKQPQEGKEMYKDTGVYAPSQELAMLAIAAGFIRTPGKQKAESHTYQSGKASFASKDISSVMDTALPAKTNKRDIANSPEEIRKKLEARRNSASPQGKASFASKDLDINTPIPEKPAASKIALEPLKTAPQPGQGKATFESKDLRGIATDVNKLKEKLAGRQSSVQKTDKP